MRDNMKLKEGYMLMELAGKYMGIYTGADPKALQGTLELNELGAFIWNHLKEDTNEDALVKCILNEYEVDEVTARADLKEILAVLKDNNIIE